MVLEKLNLTRRATVQELEEILNREKKVNLKTLEVDNTNGDYTEMENSGSIKVIDYIGGDDHIINVATNFYGLESVGNPDKKDFLIYLRENKILTPFNFSRIKTHIVIPIEAALLLVTYKKASVNEISARYSLMKTFFKAITNNEKLNDQINSMHKHAKLDVYDKFIDMNLARELARSVLGTGMKTEAYWKVGIEDLFEFIKENPKPNPHTKPYLDMFREILQTFVPLSYEAFQIIDENKETTNINVDYDLNKLRKAEPNTSTKKILNETKRETIQEAENMLGKKIPVFEHGFVIPMEYMGNDNSITDAARVSYSSGTKKVNENKTLLRYLMRNDHNTPLEMAEMQWLERQPMFSWRQSVRHRTMQPMTFMKEHIIRKEGYIPKEDQIRAQSTKNKQGRGEELQKNQKIEIINALRKEMEGQELVYELLETKHEHPYLRQFLGVNKQIDWYRQGDAHNITHFLKLRLHPHAQYEIREQAKALSTFFEKQLPETWSAFKDYKLNAFNMTSLDQEVFKNILRGQDPTRAFINAKMTNLREAGEFAVKYERLTGNPIEYNKKALLKENKKD